MRILLVISNGYICGGAEKSVDILKKNLLKNGHEVNVLASDLAVDDPTTFSDFTYPHIRPGSPSGYFKRLWNTDSYKAVKRACNDFKPDIIHYHTMGELSPSALFAAGKVPALLTVHGPEEYTKNLLKWFLETNAYKSEVVRLDNLTTFGKIEYVFYRYIQRPLYVLAFRRRLSAFISPSSYMAGALETEGYGIPIKQIYNGVELPVAKKLPKQKVILYVGRLNLVKGVSYLIAAFAELRQYFPDVQLHLVGEGPYKKRLQKQVADHKLKNSVHFLGWQSTEQVMAQFKTARLVVIPSVWPENLPTVCIEAMAIGRPIVGTNVGGIPELIHDGTNGLIVPPADASALAAAMHTILNDEHLAEAMAKASAQSSKRFSVETFVHNLEKLYRETIAS